MSELSGAEVVIFGLSDVVKAAAERVVGATASAGAQAAGVRT